MKYNPDKHHRRSIRLQGYDYSQPGAYFVTVCVQDQECLLGDIVDGEMRMNELGELVWATWHDLPNHLPHVELDAFVVMPNHVHGIVWIVDVVGAGSVGAGSEPAPTNTNKRHGLPEIVRQFKTFSARRINQRRGAPGMPVWQRNYYEHIIRNDSSLNQIQKYILENPRRWHLDRENPAVVGEDTEWESWVKQ